MGDKIFLKARDDYTNQFITTIKGYAFYKDKVTEYAGDDNEVEHLLTQGLLVIVENPKPEDITNAEIQKNDMDVTNEEYKEMLKKDKENAASEILKQLNINGEAKKMTDEEKPVEEVETQTGKVAEEVAEEAPVEEPEEEVAEEETPVEEPEEEAKDDVAEEKE